MIRALAVVFVLAAAPLAAQDPAARDALRSCLEAADRDPEAERACVGVQALACVDAGAAAQTPIGMAACAAAETAAWDDVLNATHADIVTLLRTAALAADPQATAPGAQELLLQRAQAAWSGFRDTDCAQAAAHWGADPMRAAVEAQCRLERSATRTLELMDRRRAYESS